MTHPDCFAADEHHTNSIDVLLPSKYEVAVSFKISRVGHLELQLLHIGRLEYAQLAHTNTGRDIIMHLLECFFLRAIHGFSQRYAQNMKLNCIV